MEWLNYHHLYYFWTVAREGTISQASQELRLAPSTLSKQIQQLETSLDHELFDRSGRRLVLNDFGQNVFQYADDIFRIGRELMDYAQGHPVGGRRRLNVGVTEAVPKLVVRKLLQPALEADEETHLVCREGHLPELLAALSLHQLDVVLADQPCSAETDKRVFNHSLGSCDVVFLGTGDLAEDPRRDFPDSLDGAPVLLPTTGAVLRQMLDRWFDERDLHPRVVAEFQDAAQMKSFGQTGLGIFPVPSIIADDVRRHYNVELIGRIDDISERFYAITLERKIRHPGVVRLLEATSENGE